MESKLNTENFVTKLENMHVINVSGEQMHEYLHGQLTASTQPFNEEKARISAHCDFKGKMFSVSYVSFYKDRFLLTMHKDAAAESLNQLKKYAVFSKVDITIDQDLSCFGVAGSAHKKYVHDLFPEINNKHLSVVNNSYGQAICFNDTTERYLLILTKSGQEKLLSNTKEPFKNDENLWDLLEIEAGVANIQAPTLSQFVPQMINLQCLQGIDFDKGCYMGQEVVARTKFLGKNKRAAFIVKAELDSTKLSSNELVVGENIEIKVGDNWRRGGTIMRTATVTEGLQTQLFAIIVMANDTPIGSVVRLKESNQELVVQPLPYELN